MTEETLPPPPSETSSWPTATAPALPPRSRPLPGSLLAAGVLLLVGATLAGLLTILTFFGGFLLDSMPANIVDPNGSGLTAEQLRASLELASVFIFVFGGIGVVVTLAHLLAGIGVLRRRGWARIVGLVLSVLASLLFAIGLVGSLLGPGAYSPDYGLTLQEWQQLNSVGTVVGAAIFGIGLAVYVFVGFVLIRRGAEFA